MGTIVKDIIFAAFIGLQEIGDRSYSHQLIMKARYTEHAIIFGVIFGHLVLNLLTLPVFWMFFSFFNEKNLKLFISVVIYFIIFYELIIGVLPNISRLMEFKNWLFKILSSSL